MHMIFLVVFSGL